MRDDGATDETLAAPSSTGPALAQGTTRGSAPTMNANPVPAGQETRASSSGDTALPVDPPTELPVVDRANYQIIRELARGGMGRILEAIDLRLDRPIALKEVLHGDDGARARFDREVRITAGLQHPAIVHVTEAGRWPDGQPFFAMKLIRGKPLDARIAEATTLADRLALLPAVIAVTDALAYAHSKSVIHRDLKPANVLVGDFGETVVIDWGIAKDLKDTEAIVSLTPEAPARALSGSGAETIEGSVMGTPSYMPPEQANGDRVDARADVYALGAMLYQVLAGVPPFVGRTTAEVLTKVIDGSPEPLAHIVPEAPVDLIAVVEKAMARSPDARFPTAQEMVAELKRFQQGKLVASHDYTTWQLVQRWVRRNRAAVAVGAAAVAALVVLGTLGVMAIVDERQRTELEAAAARAQADLGVISRARAALATDPTEAVALLKQLSPGTAELRAARTIASDAMTAGISHVLVGGGRIETLAFSPDGRFLASYELPGGTIRVWDVTTRTGRPIGGAHHLLDLALTADSVVAFDVEGRLYRWPSDTATPVAPTLTRTIPGVYGDAWFSPDGRRVVIAAVEEVGEGSTPRTVLKMVELADPTGTARVIGESPEVAWVPDSRSFLCLDMRTKSLLRFDAATGQELERHEHVYPVAFASDGKQTWLSGNNFRGDQMRTLHNLTTQTRIPVDFEIFELHPTRDGRLVGTTSRGTQRVAIEKLDGSYKGTWIPFDDDYLTSGAHTLLVSDGWPGSSMQLRGHSADIDTIAVSSTNLIASGDSGGEIRLWMLPPVRRDHGDGHTTTTFGAMTSTGELLITRRGPRLELRDPVTGQTRLLEVTEVVPGMERDLERRIDRSTRIGSRFVRESSIGPDDEVIELVHAADGRHLATIDSQAHVVVWDLATGRGKLLADHAIHVAIDRDGSHVVTSRVDGDRNERLVERWDVATGVATTISNRMIPAAMLFAGDRVVIASLDQSIYALEGNVLRQLPMPPLGYRTLAASADGDTLYAGADNWVIVEHRLSTKTNRSMLGHTGTIIGLLVDPSGKRVFSASADKTIRMWQTDSLSSVVLRGHTGLVTSMVLGERDTLITAATDLTTRIWDLETLDSRALAGHEDRPVFAAHVAGGQHVVVVDRFHQLASYPDNLPADERLLRTWLDAATNVAVRAD